MGEFKTCIVYSMFVSLIVTGLKVFFDLVNDILSSLHFDLFNWKPLARDFVTNSSKRYCIELVPFFSTHSARVVSSTYFQMFVFATLRSLIIIINNLRPCKDKLYRSRIQFVRIYFFHLNLFYFDLLGKPSFFCRFLWCLHRINVKQSSPLLFKFEIKNRYVRLVSRNNFFTYCLPL